MGTVVGMNIPLLPDYVEQEHIGKANAIIQIVISSAFIFSTSGLLQIGKAVSDQGLIYYSLAGVIALSALLFIFTIKDVKGEVKEKPTFGQLF